MRKILIISILIFSIFITWCNNKNNNQEIELLKAQNDLLKLQLQQQTINITKPNNINQPKVEDTPIKNIAPVKEKTKEDYDNLCDASWKWTVCDNIYNCRKSIAPGNCVCPNGVVRHKDYYCSVPKECSTEMLFATCSFWLSDNQSASDPYYWVDKTITRPIEQVQYDLCNGTCKKYFNAPWHKYNWW